MARATRQWQLDLDRRTVQTCGKSHVPCKPRQGVASALGSTCLGSGTGP